MNKKFVQKIRHKHNLVQKRLDVFVVENFGLNRSQAQKKITEGEILVNDTAQKPRYILKNNDEVGLLESTKEKAKIYVPIIHEDEDILVINKPAGISVHPAPGEKDLTVSEYFQDRLYKFFVNEDQERDGIVHRLDKGTSGVMVLAKNQETSTKLQREFKERKIKKTYFALVNGHLEPKAGTINIPITRDFKHREKMTVAEEGKEAITDFATINIYDKYSLLKLNPKTGRTHQLRVHLSVLGYPIVGDRRYGKESSLTNRIFLHAEKIEFTHPKTKKKVTFEAPLPKELEKVLEKLEN